MSNSLSNPFSLIQFEYVLFETFSHWFFPSPGWLVEGMLQLIGAGLSLSSAESSCPFVLTEKKTL